VTRVRGNTVEAEFKLPNGTYARPISITPDEDARVRIGGQAYRYRDLARGQELDVYLPPDRWELAVSDSPTEFAAAQDVTTIPIAEPLPAVAGTLPRTASPLPLVGAAGALLAAFGLLVAGIRRRLG
jgi:hypothetical protein